MFSFLLHSNVLHNILVFLLCIVGRLFFKVIHKRTFLRNGTHLLSYCKMFKKNILSMVLITQTRYNYMTLNGNPIMEVHFHVLNIYN